MTLLRPLIIGSLLVVALVTTSGAVAGPVPAEIDVCFTPAESCIPRIVAAIDAARYRILVQAYTFNSKGIDQALVRARARGVDVRAILDRSEYESGHSPGAERITAGGIPTALDSGPGGRFSIAHTKAIMIDGRLTIGGSFNYTEHSDINSVEDAAFMTSVELTGQFEKAWLARWSASALFGGVASAARR